jgi:5-formyltetrahydrofolate cyclo-ligase
MPDKPVETKEALRRRLIASRQAVASATRRGWSSAICRQVCESDVFARATHVVAYVPIGAEVDPSDAAATALDSGRGLYYPGAGETPDVRRASTVGGPGPATSDGTDVLAEDARGVLFLVPGVAFDEAGARLGRGVGWYDRLLGRFSSARRWGLAFALQVVPALPVDPWDVPMDAVVTERGRLDLQRSLRFPKGIG